MKDACIILDHMDRPISGFSGLEPVVAGADRPAHVYLFFDDALARIREVNRARRLAGLGRISFAVCPNDGRHNTP